MEYVLNENILFGQGDDTPLYLDIIHPVSRTETKPLPVIVFIHGGGWAAGDKAGIGGREWNVSLLNYGFILVNINHRLSGTAPFPANIHDCKAAIRWIRANAKEYNMDTTKIGVWGHSSGGHLAALLGTSFDIPELEGKSGSSDYSSKVQAVVTSAAPIDILSMGGWHDVANSLEARLVGSEFVHDNLDLARQLNPTTYITQERMNEMPPFLIVHGDADTLVPSSQGEILYNALEDVSFLRIKGGDHDYWGGNLTMTHVLNTIGTFFKRHLIEGIPDDEIKEIEENKILNERFIQHFIDAAKAR